MCRWVPCSGLEQPLLPLFGLLDASAHLHHLPLHLLQLLLSAHHQLEVVSQLLTSVLLLESGRGVAQRGVTCKWVVHNVCVWEGMGV